jgi:putative transposase
MNDEQRLSKNLAIKEKGVETRNRHKAMQCRVFTCKVVYNKLTDEQKEQLYGQFREAKWVYNSILSQSNDGKEIFSLTYKDFDTVTHKDKDKNDVVSPVQYLSKRELQSVISGVKTNITNLAKAKNKGLGVGSLKFISEYNSIDLPQYEKSYKIVGRNRIKVDKVKKTLYVRGLKQLYNLCVYYEMANAKLIKRPDGFYVALTVYVENSKHSDIEKPLLGIDMGCETSLTLSDGSKINAEVKETERLKRLQRSLARCKKGSNNRRKVLRKLNAEYQHMSNKRNELSRQILHYLNRYRVVIQDEQLANWQENGHGKKISHGVLGRVKNGLEDRHDTYVLSKWLPTTKLCTECGAKADLTVNDRVFVCPVCGHTEDRDTHAAKNMVWFFTNRKTLCVERTEYNREAFLNGIRVIFTGTNHETTKSLV